MEGKKFDEAKLPWHLLPGDAVEEIVKVLDFGAKKYSERNWEQGMSWNRPFAALMRHMWAWWRREEADPETGLSHLAHAGCCILFLLAYEKRTIGKDNRPTAKQQDVDNIAVLDALDAFGLALTESGHRWTTKQRRLYEKAVRVAKDNRP